MHALRLLAAFFKLNLQMMLAYRADTIVNILINLMWLGWELLGLSIIFSNTSTLGGWGLGELIVLLGVFRFVSMFIMALAWPNTEKFNASIRDGTFDYTLLQPADSMFVVSFGRMIIWRVWDLALSIGLVVWGVYLSGEHSMTFNLVSFLVLLLSGALVIYSLWIVLIAFTFWFVKFDNNLSILHALLDAGRYPASIYPSWMRLLLTFVVPIALATTVPIQGLRGELGVEQVLFYLAISAAGFWVATRVWKAGVRRYSGASS